jgi:hypothetical protein
MNDKTTELLLKLQSGEITLDECQKTLNKTQPVSKQIHYKVSTKGCISFYGVRRMPISLYQQELESILNAILEPGEPNYNQEFRAFIEDNNDKLSTK